MEFARTRANPLGRGGAIGVDGGKVEHGKGKMNFGGERGDSGISGAGKGFRTRRAPEIDEGG